MCDFYTHDTHPGHLVSTLQVPSMQFSVALKLSQTCCLPVLTEALLEWRGPMAYMVQSEGDLQTIQFHSNVSTFTVSFLGAFSTSFGDFYCSWAACCYFNGTPSQPLSGSHSQRATVSSEAIISNVKSGLFSFRYSTLHLSMLLFIFTLQSVSWGPSQTSLPCQSAEILCL